MPGEADELLLSSGAICYALGAAESLLQRALTLRAAHADLAAAWTVSPDVSRAAERVAGVPEWREILQPLLCTCLVRTVACLLLLLFACLVELTPSLNLRSQSLTGKCSNSTAALSAALIQHASNVIAISSDTRFREALEVESDALWKLLLFGQ